MTDQDDDLAGRADRVLAKAAGLPSLEQVEGLAAQAVAHGPTSDLSIAQIRGIAREAVDAAAQINALMQRLTEILDAPPPAGGEEP